MTKNILTDHQQAAMNTLVEFLDSDTSLMAILEGYAGTGKTFLMGEFIKLAQTQLQVCVAAPTHKALKVICSSLEDSGVTVGAPGRDELDINENMFSAIQRKRQETGLSAATIHSLLALKMVEKENGEAECRPDPSRSPTLSEYGLVVIDESSLISRAMFELIMKCKQFTKVLFIGDPAQLPPIEDKNQISPVFTYVDLKVRLNEIVRQADDNPIIKLSMAIRNSQAKFSVADFLRVLPPLPANAACVSGNMSDLIQYAASEQRNNRDARVLCYRNAVVSLVNAHVHNELHPGTLFAPGERVLNYFSAGGGGDKSPIKDELGNEYKARLMDEFIVISCVGAEDDTGLKVMLLTMETATGHVVSTLIPRQQKIYQAEIDKLWAEYRSANTAYLVAKEGPGEYAAKAEKSALSRKAYAMRNRYPDLRHAYAMTVHRSQGSTFDTALVHYNDLNTMRSAFEFNRALYVACTRPRQYLAVVV